MTNGLNLSLAVSTGSLESYSQGVRNIPILSAEDEHALALRLRDHGDLEAAQQLVISHMRFVMHIARSYSGYGLAQADLIQEGNIGLMKAVKRFDPDKGVRLVSFAVYWIRAEIHEFVLRNWRIVKVATTKAQRKLFFNLRRAKKRLGWLTHDEVNAVADDLGVSSKDVYEMESRLSGHDLGFDEPADDDSESFNPSPIAYLQDMTHEPASIVEENDHKDHNQQRLHSALSDLDERSRDIVQNRWLTDDKMTLHNLADRYEISAERVRQLENNAIKKLRTAMI